MNRIITPATIAAPEGSVIAVLGPTNTGKTHYAIDRMLAHKDGVIGFPLRLLAREVYDRVVALRGPSEVALITGEEKIVPPKARYFFCTVESMPLDIGADFVAVDEIQLAADPDRGHVFTDRLLRARGRHETLFLGSSTIRSRIADLIPAVRFMERDRLSTLTYAGPKKLSRLPARSAIVSFSADSVYGIAELLRRQKGGAAVVLGALSPRTRNAQVALYQEGDVDYLVATDAIGMGLNLDVKHISFAGLNKFDGRRRRPLEPNELAQIAGRAGRYMTDGTFGVTGEAAPLDDEMINAIENHSFRPVTRLEWRNSRLDFGTPQALITSLEADPGNQNLIRARDADDLIALRHLAGLEEVAERARGRSGVTLLWDVCQVPDFRKSMASEHAALLSQLYRFLSSDYGVIPEDWMATQVSRLDRTEGDIDTLSKRLAYVRSWTYVANRSNWLADPEQWRGETRSLEDKLSDALHARLTQRFVDRRTSVLARRLKQKESLVAEIETDGSVTVEGEFVGKLDGFRFQPDPTAAGAEVKTLQAASVQALTTELARRVDKFYRAADAEIDVTHQGGLMWGDAAVGRLESRYEEGADPLAVRAEPFVDDSLDPALREKVVKRLQVWIDRKIAAAFEPLIAVRDDPGVTGLARGVAFRLLERFGVIPRSEIADDVKSLDQDSRSVLRKHGVRFGQHTIFFPALLKPAPTRLRMLLWGLAQKQDEIPAPPPPGLVTIPADPAAPDGFYTMAGYRLCGPRAIRLDMLERLADMIRPLDQRGGFEATADMLSITGATLEQFAEMMSGLGYQAERGERAKVAKPATEAEAKPAAKADAESKPEGDTPPSAVAEPEDAPQTATEGSAGDTPPVAVEVAGADTAADAQAEENSAAPPAEAAEPAASAEPETPTEPGSESASPDAEAQGTGSGSGSEAGDEPDAETPTEAVEAAVETEVFFTFRYQPKGRRQRREGPAGDAAGAGRGPRRNARGGGGKPADAQGPKGGGKKRHGGKPPHGGKRNDSQRSSQPPREKRADPDSPFAILQKLKEKS